MAEPDAAATAPGGYDDDNGQRRADRRAGRETVRAASVLCARCLTMGASVLKNLITNSLRHY